ncbi:MAG: ABC transporter permease [Pyrinomonadaceae bacterium]|nr:ABC transporter permease [Pyrinomonadaceae bacterium]
MSDFLNLAFLFSALTSATPLIFAALGGLFSERSGVINIALEGLMLSGAFTAAVVTYQTGNPYLGLLCGVASGILTAAIYAVSVIKFEADQVVAGMAINLLMLGLPALISGVIYDSTGSTPQIDQAHKIPMLFGGLSYATILAFLCVPLSWYVLAKTRFGLRLRAVGENPEAADSAGVNVVRLRYAAVIISGVLASIGGAFLSTGQSSLFTRGMSAGRGFIALAALILAKWKPVPVLFACLFFGFTEAMTIQIQGASWARIGDEQLPIQFIEMIPYVLTIIVLAGFIGLSRAPKALGLPYRKEN